MLSDEDQHKLDQEWSVAVDVQVMLLVVLGLLLLLVGASGLGGVLWMGGSLGDYWLDWLVK